MFEFFDHTADVGIRIEADSLNGLFEEAGRGLFALIVNDLASVRAEQTRQLELSCDDRELLLRDWLAELLYTFDAEQLLLSQFDVTIDDGKLSATAHGEPFDDQRHDLQCEIKAVTYHGLAVRQSGNRWQAEVIVDI